MYQRFAIKKKTVSLNQTGIEKVMMQIQTI